MALIFLLIFFSLSCFSQNTNNIIYGSGAYDADSNFYKSIIIGNQEWLAENIKSTKFSDGTEIKLVQNNERWEFSTDPAYCYYDNKKSNALTYGLLYNFYVATDAKNICPTGWHVPADYEWFELSTYIGGVNIAGGILKSKGNLLDKNGLWEYPNLYASDTFGFSALPGGFRGKGSFFNIGRGANFWSSTGDIMDYAWFRNLYFSHSELNRINISKSTGFSIRCLRD